MRSADTFGPALTVSVALARPWLSLGPGWAALAGVFSSGYPPLTFASFLQLVGLWLLAELLLGSLWELVVRQQLWPRLRRLELPPPAASGIALPYARPGSAGGRLVVRLRRYQHGLRQQRWPDELNRLATVGLISLLALLLGAALHQTVLWLVLPAIGLTLLAGFASPSLAAPGGGRLQALVQFLLPWGMGLLLFPDPQLVSLLLAFLFWLVYWGGLRLAGNHHRADWLFFLAQIAIILLLLLLQLLPAAAIVTVLLAAQGVIRTAAPSLPLFAARIHRLLWAALLTAALAVGALPGLG